MSVVNRLLKRLLVGLVVLMLLLVAMAFWLGFTESGLRVGLSLARGLMPEGVSIASVEGQLTGPLRLRGVAITSETATIEIERFELQWQAHQLFSGLVHIDSLTVSGINVVLHPTSSQDTSEPVVLPERIALPVDVVVDELLVDSVRLSQGEIAIAIDRLRAQAQWLDTAFTLTSLSVGGPMFAADMSAEVATAGDYPLALTLAAQLTQELDLPVTGEFQLVATGPLTDLSIEGEAQAVGDGLPLLSATYSSNVQTHRSDLTNFALTARLAVSGDDIQTSAYVEELPGTVSLDVLLDVAQEAGGVPTVEVSRLHIAGDLLEQALSITGGGRWVGDSGRVENLQALWGDNSVLVNGAVGANSELGWTAKLPALAQFGAVFGTDLQGAMTGSGRLLGTLAEPRVVAELEASSVFLQGISASSANLSADLSLEGELRLNVLIADATVADEPIDEVRLELSGVRASHELAVLIEAPRAELVMEAAGSLDTANIWRFDLSQLELVHPDLSPRRPDHRWRLDGQTEGRVASGDFVLEKMCLRHVLPDDGGGLCVDAAFAGGNLSANAALTRLNLANLNSVLPADARMAGELSGQVQWSGDVSATQASFELTDVGLALLQGSDWLNVAEFSAGVINVAPVTDALQVSVDLPLRADEAKGLFADVQIGFPPRKVLTAGAAGSVGGPLQVQSDLSGTIRAELPDLGWLAAFSEQVDEVAGSLVSDVRVAGTLAEPQLTGVTVLDFPKVAVGELNIVLNNSRLTLEGTPKGLRLQGKTESGGGVLSLDSTVKLVEDLEVTGALTGKDFLLSDTAEARISVSPDLSGIYAEQTLKLGGVVSVPIARITLDRVPDGAVAASADQQFPEQIDAAAALASEIDLRLELGDEVSFSGLGLNATFAGALAISDRSNQATTATGEIEVVDGTYKAYGQDLQINNGKMVFAGGPIDEPGLNFRAVRQATPEVEVGVLVQGSLRAPKLDVFSTPSLPQSDQLSYLVLGRPLSASSASENSLLQQAAMAIGVQGGTLLTDRIGSSLGVDTFGIESAPGTSNAQAALVVGKYLSPRLYVSYGYGLFEPISTLRLEYQLNRLWRIVTESTNIATGGDFLWVHER